MQSIYPANNQGTNSLHSAVPKVKLYVLHPIRAAAIIQQLMTNEHEYSKIFHANIRFANTWRPQRGRATKEGPASACKEGHLTKDPARGPVLATGFAPYIQAQTQKNWPSLKIGVAAMLQKCMLLIIH